METSVPWYVRVCAHACVHTAETGSRETHSGEPLPALRLTLRWGCPVTYFPFETAGISPPKRPFLPTLGGRCVAGLPSTCEVY